MGYFSERAAEDYDREYDERNSKKSTTSKQNSQLSKEELINSIMEEDPMQNKELLECYNEYYLKRVLRQILSAKKRSLVSARNKRYENPFAKYDRMQDERLERWEDMNRSNGSRH